MSRYDYDMSLQIRKNDFPFYSLVMAAMRQADSENLVKLAKAFPDTFAELDARYNAPGGVLESDPDYYEYTQWRNDVLGGGSHESV